MVTNESHVESQKSYVGRRLETDCPEGLKQHHSRVPEIALLFYPKPHAGRVRHPRRTHKILGALQYYLGRFLPINYHNVKVSI